MRVHCVIMLCVTIILMLVVVAESGSLDGDDGGKVIMRKDYILPKLFDFKYFKSVFSKQYKTMLEEIARRKYFLSRAFRVFVSAVKYKWRKLGYYLALNEMSDYSPMELAKMKNGAEARKELSKQRVQAKREGRKMEKSARDASSGVPKVSELEASDSEIAQKLGELAAEHPEDTAYKELLVAAGEKLRRTRSISAASEPQEARHLSLEALIKTHEPVFELTNSVGHNVRLRVPSNNPNYEPLELSSKGLDDQQESLDWFRIRGKNEGDPERIGQVIGSLKSAFGDEVPEFQKMVPKLNELHGWPDEEIESDGPDEMFVDHRDKCMGMVRQQGQCGSCYAFAAVALLEWLHCQRTGSFTPFSEQYIVDCGSYVSGLLGCQGGDRLSVIEFIHNFGAELRVSYPYRMRTYQCPYPKEIDLKTTGYIRPNLGSAVIVPRKKWATYVKFSPLMASIFTSEDFSEYGGGVHEIRDCNLESGHAMLLVGHGREDGQEFWLFRNSYSVGWGDEGYYKLSKRSSLACIFIEGITIGSLNAVQFEAKPVVNKHNDRSHIKRHNVEIMKSDLENGAF